MSKNQSLLSMMTPEAQKQVLLLIKRLGDQKQAKEQAERQCLQYEAEIKELKKQLQKLKKQNISLKAKWQNSFQMLSKVRQNFSGSKKNNEMEGSMKKKLRFNKQLNNWQEQSQEEDESNPNQVRQNNVIEVQDKKNKNGPTNKLQQQQYSQNRYFAIDSPNKTQPMSKIQTSRSCQQYTKEYGIVKSSVKKPPRNPQFQQSNQKKSHQQNKQKLNTTNRSNKKLQIDCLKQQIEQLTEEIKKKQTGTMTLNDKIKKCQEIKNRYKKPPSLQPSASRDDLSAIKYPQHTAQTDPSLISYHSPNKYYPQSSIYHQQSVIHQQSSNQNPQSPYSATNQKPNFPSTQNIHFTSTFNQLHEQSRKQNIQTNSLNQQLNNNMLNRTLINQKTILIQQHPTHHTIKNQSLINNSHQIKKNSTKSVTQQSFYDDGLLDLIAEINP